MPKFAELEGQKGEVILCNIERIQAIESFSENRCMVDFGDYEENYLIVNGTPAEIMAKIEAAK